MDDRTNLGPNRPLDSNSKVRPKRGPTHREREMDMATKVPKQYETSREDRTNGNNIATRGSRPPTATKRPRRKAQCTNTMENLQTRDIDAHQRGNQEKPLQKAHDAKKPKQRPEGNPRTPRL